MAMTVSALSVDVSISLPFLSLPLFVTVYVYQGSFYPNNSRPSHIQPCEEFVFYLQTV